MIAPVENLKQALTDAIKKTNPVTSITLQNNDIVSLIAYNLKDEKTLRSTYTKSSYKYQNEKEEDLIVYGILTKMGSFSNKTKPVRIDHKSYGCVEAIERGYREIRVIVRATCKTFRKLDIFGHQLLENIPKEFVAGDINNVYIMSSITITRDTFSDGVAAINTSFMHEIEVSASVPVFSNIKIFNEHNMEITPKGEHING